MITKAQLDQWEDLAKRNLENLQKMGFATTATDYQKYDQEHILLLISDLKEFWTARVLQREPSGIRQKIQFPLRQGFAVFEVELPISKEDWKLLMDIFEAMKDALVKE